MSSVKKTNLNLNLIRIFAAWMVLSVHIANRLDIDFSVGAKGVQLFFMLSGYLAFCSLANQSSPGAYYKKRIVRILPTYWLSLMLLYCRDFLFGLLQGFSPLDLFTGQCSPRFLRYVFGLQCILPSENWALWNNRSALWTMSSFFAFYVIAPLLFKILKKFRIAVLLTLAAMLFREPVTNLIQLLLSPYPPDAHIEWFAGSNPLTQLHCFLLGITIYLAHKEHKDSQCVFGAILVLIVTQLNWYVYELLFMLLLFAAVELPPLSRSPALGRLASFLSDGSFALYLIHPMIFTVLPTAFLQLASFPRLAIMINAAIQYIVCILVTYTLYYLIISRLERVVYQRAYNQ